MGCHVAGEQVVSTVGAFEAPFFRDAARGTCHADSGRNFIKSAGCRPCSGGRQPRSLAFCFSLCPCCEKYRISHLDWRSLAVAPKTRGQNAESRHRIRVALGIPESCPCKNSGSSLVHQRAATRSRGIKNTRPPRASRGPGWEEEAG